MLDKEHVMQLIEWFQADSGLDLKDLINQYLEDHKHLKLEKLDMRIITHSGVERYYAIVVFHPATKPYKTREVSK